MALVAAPQATVLALCRQGRVIIPLRDPPLRSGLLEVFRLDSLEAKPLRPRHEKTGSDEGLAKGWRQGKVSRRRSPILLAWIVLLNERLCHGYPS